MQGLKDLNVLNDAYSKRIQDVHSKKIEAGIHITAPEAFIALSEILQDIVWTEVYNVLGSTSRYKKLRNWMLGRVVKKNLETFLYEKAEKLVFIENTINEKYGNQVLIKVRVYDVFLELYLGALADKLHLLETDEKIMRKMAGEVDYPRKPRCFDRVALADKLETGGNTKMEMAKEVNIPKRPTRFRRFLCM